jgi:hypothetical protein
MTAKPRRAKPPKATGDAVKIITAERDKAVRSLLVSGYVDLGGELWKPPLGKNPLAQIDELRSLTARLAELEAVIREVQSEGETRRGMLCAIDGTIASNFDILTQAIAAEAAATRGMIAILDRTLHNAGAVGEQAQKNVAASVARMADELAANTQAAETTQRCISDLMQVFQELAAQGRAQTEELMKFGQIHRDGG